MFDSITIQDANGVDVVLHDNTHRVGECNGLHGAPTPRRISRERPGGHGEILETKHLASRQPVFNGWLIGANEAALWAEYDTIIKAVWDAVDTPRLLKWTRGDAKAFQSYVRLGEAFDPVIRASDAGRILAYQVIFDREDPRNYSQTATTATGEALSAAAGGLTFAAPFPWKFTPSGAGTVLPNNTGTVPTPAVFRVYGYVTAPTILHVETGRRIVLTSEVSAGDYLEVDAATRTVELNGSTDRTNLLDFASTNWLAGDVPRGQQTYRLLASNFDANARLDVVYRPASG